MAVRITSLPEIMMPGGITIFMPSLCLYFQAGPIWVQLASSEENARVALDNNIFFLKSKKGWCSGSTT